MSATDRAEAGGPPQEFTTNEPLARAQETSPKKQTPQYAAIVVPLAWN